jgi:plasmid stabilization system protein ParE
VRVSFTDEAKAQVRRRREWWARNRDRKVLFTQDLRAAQRELQHAPRYAVHGVRDGREVRRLALSRVHCFVYYVILEEQNRVEIISVWGQEQESQPFFVDQD